MSYELIETVEVGSGGASSIEFTSIPQDGTDLVCVHSLKSNHSADLDQVILTINNDSGTNYSYVRLNGDGGNVETFSSSSATSFELAIYVDGDNVDNTNTFGNGEIRFSNFTSSNSKSVSMDTVSEGNAARLFYQTITAGLYDNSSAITSFKLEPRNGTSFLQYSTASLYKITAA